MIPKLLVPIKYSEEYKQYNSFVADENDNLVGMIGSFESDNETMTIVGVYVKPEFRGSGIASILMENILNKIKSNRKYKKVRLSVNKDQTAALKLYEKFGFKEVDREIATLGDGAEHEELVMELIL